VPFILVRDGVYLIPRRDGHLLVGSTLEDVGFDKQTTVSARDYLLSHAHAILPSLADMPVIRQWSGLRPASIDNIPTIGKHPILSNVWINTGHFRYGVTMAPGSAEILVNAITGTRQPFDITAYRRGWESTS
jgi:glycine oxidase